MTGHTQPNQQYLHHGASVVELYQCTSCHSYIRFPRYNDPAKLLQTRRGRCGEWANCFTLCCRAVGVEARLVLDKTDHVWTEIYSNYQRRWIHCDPCEDVFDRPLMYSAGWNKELTYCIAYSSDEVVDVTRRYVRDWPKVLQRRRLVDEQLLSDSIADMCRQIKERRIADNVRQVLLDERHKDEQDELQKASLLPPALKDDDMLGRQSGSMAWRMLRGEQGKGLSCSIANANIEAPEFNDTEKQLVFEHPTTDHMQLLGSAKIMEQQIQLLSPESPSSSSVWRLTTAGSSQCGGIFRQESMDMIVDKGMETEFAIRLTNNQGGPAFGGADGMAFVIQAGDSNGAQLGEGGCELGYGGIKNSLAVEFDTYDSSDRCADPSSNHISVHARLPPYGNSAHHDFSLKHTSVIPALNSGDWIHCRIRYLATTQTLEVALKEAAPSLSSSSLASSSTYITVLTVNNLDMAAYVTKQGSSSICWVGFTASTGGLSQNHDVSWFSLSSYN
ncbi:unnamed protein product [Absidia cylindrospora]